MKAKEVLTTLGISRRTLTRYIKKQLIKVTKLPNGRYIYDDDSVYGLLKGRHIVSLFEIMMHVAELGLLRKNKEELARIEGYMQAYDTYNDAESNIDDYGITSARYIGPGVKEPVKDITFEILLYIYGKDEDEAYYNCLERE